MLSPATLTIAKAVHTADITSSNLKGDADYPKKIILWADYLHACQEMITQQPLLSDEILQKRIGFIGQDSHLAENFPSGYRCCVTVIPCTNGGFAFDAEDIARGYHVLTLLINTQDMVIGGFAMQPSPLFQLLPVEVQQQLVFTIPEYTLEGSFGVPFEVRQKIMDEYTRVYKKAQEMFNI